MFTLQQVKAFLPHNNSNRLLKNPPIAPLTTLHEFEKSKCSNLYLPRWNAWLIVSAYTTSGSGDPDKITAFDFSSPFGMFLTSAFTAYLL